MITKDADLKKAKILNRWAIVFTILVYLLMGLMRQVSIPTTIDFSFLPKIYSTLNAVTSMLLINALIQIKRKNIEKHRNSVYLALFFSAVFLLLYVLYHFTTPETAYCGEGTIRNIYFLLLGTHIVLAALMLPFILLTFIRAYTHQFEKHKRMARWVWPCWLYVSLTGPIVYILLAPCY